MRIIILSTLVICHGMAGTIVPRESTPKQGKIQRFQDDIVQLESELEHVKQEVNILEKISVQRVNEDRCNHLLVSGDKPIPDARISASSSVDANHGPSRARIHKTAYKVGSWCARTNNIHEWLEFDLGKIRTVTGVITKGRFSPTYEQFVKSYKIYYGQRKLEWHAYKNKDGTDKVFEGNFDFETAKINVLDPPITAQYIRINPQTWYGHISMRADLLGCV